MIKYFTCLLIIFFGLSAFWQERVLLKGRILTPDKNTSSINIINLTSQKGTTNTADGEFQVMVKNSDMLLFSSVQYELREVFITVELLQKAFLTVLLVEMIDELEEVNIRNISLSGNLATDITNIPTLTPADPGFPMSDKPRLTSIERRLKTASNVFGIY